MARQIDYEALIEKMEATDVFLTLDDDDPVILAVCMECEAEILRAIKTEVTAAALHFAIVDHDCEHPADTVVIDYEPEDLVITDADEADVPGDSETPAPDDRMPTRELRLSDRCDRCGAQAFVRVDTPAGSVFLCGHDYAAAELTITAAGYPVEDERWAINSKPSTSATAE